MAEKEYIEREAAIDACFDGWDNNAHDCAENIRSIPAADVRPVVLCRDCQYFENDCGWCGYFDIGMNVNDFCSQGKREEN